MTRKKSSKCTIYPRIYINDQLLTLQNWTIVLSFTILIAYGRHKTRLQGVTALGMTAPGLTAPGMTAPGLTAPGMTAPGMTAPGITAPA
jgi:hypothetical protein